MGRDVRRVPENWDHPKMIHPYRDGECDRPMRQASFDEAYTEWETGVREWYANYRAWEAGTFDAPDDAWTAKCRTYEDYAGAPPTPPNPYDYMPVGTWWQLYEDTSEGTPLSPPFATAEELIAWLSTNPDFWGNQWSAESARGIVEHQWAPSFIFTPSTGFRSPEQFMAGMSAAQEEDAP